ncbi:RNA-binding domain-containing protein [Penicillium alfredii]|uniref:RNA-binding domain-containing protein n=1 Tax=Penicillium alfredii TaxID=1506179 RepID=A0A9W9KFT5_9EURO|nr:RNA-binding domain-containing protein [Penicillium alfredii]KAJ5104880.1 RNA-binding domain-containing protein [Penicillium alfredii]
MDRSLDEIIAEDTFEAQRKQPRPSGGRRGQGRRRDHDGVRKVTASPHPVYLDIPMSHCDWVHDKYEDNREARPARGSRRSRQSPSPDRGPTLTKVRVENLHYDITESDLEDLFGRIGPVSALSLVYDRAGRSEGVAFVTYAHLKDAHTSLREFDGANAKGQPIRLALVPGRRERNAFDSAERPKSSLFDRVERPHGRDARSLSPGSASDGGRRRRRGGRAHRSDVSKPAPDHIDRYVPGQRSPVRRNGGRRGGGRDNRTRGTDNSNRRTVNGRPRKTQEELDQEMEDYWGGNDNAGAGTAEQQPVQNEPQQVAPASAAAAGDDDIDMIE